MTQLCLRNDYLDFLIDQANSEVKKFYDWSTAKRLLINTDKTFTTIITNKRLPQLYPQIHLNSHPTTEFNRTHHYETRHRHDLNPRFQWTLLIQRLLTSLRLLFVSCVLFLLYVLCVCV